MSNEIEQAGNGKIECTINFTKLPATLQGNPVVMAAQTEWGKKLSETLTSQLHGRINREGVFNEARGTAPIIDFNEGDNSVQKVLDRWLEALVGEPPAGLPEMQLAPEIVEQAKNELGVDLSEYTITDVQYVAPHVFNINLV